MYKHQRFPIICLVVLLLGMTYLASPLHAEQPYKLRTVVIDAGHGGKDPGCHGQHTNEKDITLAISTKLGRYIKEYFKNVKVIYTRTKDVFVPLHKRAAIANKAGADLFISVHCNASKSSAYGTETYVMGLDKSTSNLEVAIRENGVIKLETNYHSFYDGFDPGKPETKIIFSLYQNSYLNQSIDLASEIERELKDRAKRSSRGVKQAGFLVLYKTTMPSVLVETGFLTNKTEERFLKSTAGQKYIASAIFRAFRKYKLGLEKQESGSLEFPEFFNRSLRFNTFWLQGKLVDAETNNKDEGSGLFHPTLNKGCFIERIIEVKES